MRMVLAVLLVLAVLALLEVLNAVFESFRQGHLEELSKKQQVSLLAFPLYLVRFGLGAAIAFGSFISLIGHEVSHAIAQALFGARPRVVLCKNGGYAEGRPWAGGPFKLIYGIGLFVGRGVMALAPALGMGTLVYVLLRYALPLPAGTLGATASALGDHVTPRAAVDVLAGFARVFAHAGVLRILIILVGGILLCPALTPSSVDYYNARWHVPAYAAALTGAAWWYGRGGSAWALVGAGAIVFVAGFFAIPKLKDAAGLPVGAGGTLILLGLARPLLGAAPELALVHGVVGLATILLAAAFVYLLFFGVFVVAALTSLRVSRVVALVRHVPGELADVVTIFYTCKQCNVHFRKKCDGCGRTVEQIQAAKA